jgi:hypothetical protein
VKAVSAPAGDEEAALSAAAAGATPGAQGSPSLAGGLVGPMSAPTAAPAATERSMDRCANCEALLSGPYCSQCGQRHEPAVHSFWHFMREGFEDLTHADSRLWRTLRDLVFRPGFLTREFLEGRRARYLPPVRLYLVLSIVFFLIAGVVMSHSPGGTVLVVTPSKITFRQLGTTTPASARQVCAKLRQEVPWLGTLGPRLEGSCVATIEDGGRSGDEAVLHNIPRAMFFFLPLLGLVMKALYRRPRRHYVEHLLFFVHNHAFIFLALAVLTLLGAILPAPVTAAASAFLWIYVALYFLVSMRKVYGQGWPATVGKLAALSFAYLVLGGLMLTTITLYAMLTL